MSIPTQQTHIGGSFAPPFTDDVLANYKETIESLNESPVKSACEMLLRCCGVWWDLPEPDGTATSPHPVRGTIVALQTDHAEILEAHIPWAHELESMKVLFDSISNESDKPLRDLAHHLLWHVIELDKGREPLTADKL